MRLLKKINRNYRGFLLPALIIYSVLIIYPMLSTFFYSFTNWNGFTDNYDFVGLRNFINFFRDQHLGTSLLNTLKAAIVIVFIQNILGLFFALILDSSLKTKNILRTLLFIPVVISPMVVSYVWSYMYSYDVGLLNEILRALGLGAVDWLGDYNLAMFSVAFVTVWQSLGFTMVIYLASLQNVPNDVIEAAKIDGASRARILKDIKIPFLAPAITINVILCTIGGLRLFDTVFIMTKGGPGYATETIATMMYSKAFDSGNMGYGSAIGLILLFFVATISITQSIFLRRREIEQ